MSFNMLHLLMRGRDVSDPKGFVVERWISLLGLLIKSRILNTRATYIIIIENDFPVYDVDGNRSIPWTTLPLWLARRRQYIDGCPERCLPKIEDDRVVKSSSPYNNDLAQMHAITRAFVNGEVSLRMRPDGMCFNVIINVESAERSV